MTFILPYCLDVLPNTFLFLLRVGSYGLDPSVLVFKTLVAFVMSILFMNDQKNGIESVRTAGGEVL